MSITLEHLGPLLVHQFVFKLLLLDCLDLIVSVGNLLGAFHVHLSPSLFLFHVLLVLLEELLELLLLFLNSLVSFSAGKVSLSTQFALLISLLG